MSAFDAFKVDPAALHPATRAGRAAHLEFLQLMRDGRLWKPRRLGWGAVGLSIPEPDYYLLLAEFPELASPDAATSRAAWRAFAWSTASEIYRLSRGRVL
jgi:hypothetical protein